MPTAVVFGCTGAVGSQILATLLSTPSSSTSPTTPVTRITTISRRSPSTSTEANSRLHTIVEPDSTEWSSSLTNLSPVPDTVYNALGTTRAAAGSIAAQWTIDHDLCVSNAQAAKKAGVETYVYCSSAGTAQQSILNPFAFSPYAKMKRGVETAIRECEFENAVVLRPGMILGREVSKSPRLESMFAGLKRFGQGFQDKWAQDQTVIGRAAVAAVRIVEQGKAPSKYWVLEQADIVRLGRDEWKEDQ